MIDRELTEAVEEMEKGLGVDGKGILGGFTQPLQLDRDNRPKNSKIGSGMDDALLELTAKSYIR